jgi:hypothetical protein
MSFAMTHIAVAKEVNDSIKIVKDFSNYYLGTISPDCVHVRKEYNSDMKKNSHFCVGNEGWGRITNNQEWRNNVLSLLSSYKNHLDFDFFLGYFIHVLVDVSDNEKIHIPFKKKYEKEGLPLNDRGRVFYNDKSRNDFELFHFFEWKDEVWSYLADSYGVGISPVIESKETKEYRDIVLHQYDSGVSAYKNPNTFFSLSDNLAFIKNTGDEIVQLLQSAL